jgi:hypothetical protein
VGRAAGVLSVGGPPVRVLAVMAVLALPTEARAVRLDAPPTATVARYQRWADAARVPTAATRVRLRVGPTPCPEGACAFATRPYPTIWVRPDWTDRLTLYHELGHVFDYVTLGDDTRSAFRSIVHDRRAWRSAPNSPHEQFAEAYSLAARFGRRWRRARRYRGGYGYSPTRRQYLRVIRLIRGAGMSQRRVRAPVRK